MVAETLVGSAATYFQLARFFLVFFLGLAVTKGVLMPMARWMAGRRSDEKKAVYSAENLIGVVGVFIALTAALQAGGFGNIITVVGAVAAASTIAVGFGMREQIANLVSGVFIQIDSPFVREDYIRAGDIEGTVKDVKLRETRLRSPTGEKLVVPNSYLSNNPLNNFTKDRLTFNRLDITVPPAEAGTVADLLEDLTGEIDEVLEEPAPDIHYDSLGEESVEIQFMYAVKDSADLKDIRSALVNRLRERGVDAGIFTGEDSA